jgi:SARP family transcriptional regulator, regulator of embCAB operon
MEIEILGSLVVTAGDRHPVGGTKVRTTLAMLALNLGRVVSCEELVDELWGERPPRTAGNALQAHITRLRRLFDSLGHRALVTVDRGYLLDLPHHAIDANRFQDLAASGARAVAHQPQLAVEILERALRLWRGPALFDAGQGARCRAAAIWLDESHVIAREDLMSARLALGDERAVASELEHLVAQYPLRERLYDLLMLALYRAGRQADALDAFHRLRRRLGDDLGLQPDVRLQRRYRAILSHDPALALPRSA